MSGENAPALPFAADRPEAGRIEEVATGIRRLVAPNPGPFTFTGTCTYVVGTGEVAVIDPGPEDAGHIARLLAALGSERVAAILVTHTHRDHSPGARLLAAATGAPILGAAPHRAFRALATGEANALEGSADTGHAPDRVLADGEDLAVGEDRLVALATPGHTVNHLAFALEGRGIVFSGDHVMGWSTSIVAPPDGAMKPYRASRESRLMREDAR